MSELDTKYADETLNYRKKNGKLSHQNGGDISHILPLFCKTSGYTA